ncbi:MAG: zinc-ribbon domain-containing protein [Lutibacter sp.]|uniref:AIM24 family protein n=1 Tax=Lutibacter sp. TaxID=1925666 RepID=UPI00179DFE87|nr:AIM24 family protein [Lutibacter sp.]MBT8316124.1 AIM24 family protein [Lutibacter sp.]NNJ56984.1 zinc-ribbon domain-containing protein [Lutibacter sp.]
MAFCSNCGSKLNESSAFCENCGTQIKEVETQPIIEEILGEVTFEVVNKERLNLIKVELDNAAFRYESGAMHYMNGNLELQSKAPGIGKIFKSMITKEAIVKPVIKGSGTVFLQPSFGEFTILNLENEEWILDRGAYFASDINIEIGSYTNKAISAIFSGEKWFQTVVSGTGKVIITSAGPIEEVELTNGKLVVDGAFAIARTSGIELNVSKATKGIFSTLISGEGIVNTFTGTGKVLIAPVDNYLNTLINSILSIRYQIQSLRK